MTDIPMNPECATCPVRGNGCSRLFHLWKQHRTIRRPELVRLLTSMLSANLEAHCHQLNPSLDEIEQRPVVKANRCVPAGDKKPEVSKPAPIEPAPAETSAAKPISPVMVGRMPRNKFSLREEK